MGSQTDLKPTERKYVSSAGTQATIEDRYDLEELMAKLDTGATLNDLGEWTDEKWPENVIVATKVEFGTPASPGEDDEMNIVIDTTWRENGKLFGSITTRIPSLSGVISKDLIEGEVGYLKCCTKIETSRGIVEASNKYVYVIPLEVNRDGVNDLEKM